MGKIGYQLYGVRDMLAENTENTMRLVANLGFEGVEYSGMTSTPALTFRKLQNKFNLVCCGNHVGLGEWLKNGVDPIMEYNYLLGNPDIGCHWLNPPERGSKEKWISHSEFFNKLGVTLKENGFGFYYHNHAYEYEEVYDGQSAMDLVLEKVHPCAMSMELHIAALPHFNIDTVAYINQLGPRLSKLHVPVLDKEGNVIITQEIIDAAKATGCPWYIIEQQVPDKPTCESLARSIEILRDMLNK